MNAKTAGMQPDAADVYTLPRALTLMKRSIRCSDHNPKVWFWWGQNRSGKPCPTPHCHQQTSLTILSGADGVAVELASGGRTGVRSTSDKKGSKEEHLRYPLCIWTNSLDNFYSQLRESSTSHSVHLVPKLVSKIDQDESCPKILTAKGTHGN